MDLGDKAIVINSLSSLQLIFLTSDIYLKPIDFFFSEEGVVQVSEIWALQ